MRKFMWAVQLGNKNILSYEYSDCDLKVALFRTKSRAQAWLADNPLWRSRSAKVVKVVVQIETF
jgi:hypothetical protein